MLRWEMCESISQWEALRWMQQGVQQWKRLCFWPLQLCIGAIGAKSKKKKNIQFIHEIQILLFFNLVKAGKGNYS